MANEGPERGMDKEKKQEERQWKGRVILPTKDQ